MRRPIFAAPALALILAITLTGCGSHSSDAAPPAPTVTGQARDRTTTSYDAAVSTPVEDSVYPDVGDPGVDALHYALDLTWDAKKQVLTATETLLFRAATNGSSIKLDLAHQLTVGHVWLDGTAVDFQHESKDLVVRAPVRAGYRHVLQLTYSGTPEPVQAPTDRPDFSTTGWTVDPDGNVWTMQEPYGAYSWYAVNDQPSDKAFYDVTIHAPAPMLGITGGTLRSRRASGGTTTTVWRLPEPAASYLVTISIGRYTATHDTGPHGLPITYWTPSDRPGLRRGLRYTPRAVAFLERRLGRFPFPTLGVLLVRSNSAMETQSTLTLGINGYTLSRDVLVHELAHQWYGDEVTPSDWSDLWMSEGMALYLAEGVWSGAHTKHTFRQILVLWARSVGGMRATDGPPAAYRPQTFGKGNAYYIPGLMWDTIRQRLGDRLFWKLVRAWPRTHRFTSQGRDDLIAWWTKRSGRDLAPLFHRWLLGSTEPAYHSPPD